MRGATSRAQRGRRQSVRRLAERMREQRLTFGGRLLCPFLRPFFLTRDDERRVVARGGDASGRSASASPRPRSERPDLFDELG